VLPELSRKNGEGSMPPVLARADGSVGMDG
jgi:hypothetical protein